MKHRAAFTLLEMIVVLAIGIGAMQRLTA